MAPGRAILQGIDAKPVNLIFEFTIFGSPKSNFQKGRPIYTAAQSPVHTSRNAASEFLSCCILISGPLCGDLRPLFRRTSESRYSSIRARFTARRHYCLPRRPEVRLFQSAL